jgi:hypothetical protein
VKGALLAASVLRFTVKEKKKFAERADCRLMRLFDKKLTKVYFRAQFDPLGPASKCRQQLMFQ